MVVPIFKRVINKECKMLIHAHRRKEATPIDTGNTHIEFKPNERGDVIAEVESDEDSEKLLAIPEAFRIYQVVEAKEPKAPAKEPKASFVVTDGDTTLDLSEMDDVALRAFADANGVVLHHKNTGDTIRQKIVDALTGK